MDKKEKTPPVLGEGNRIRRLELLVAVLFAISIVQSLSIIALRHSVNSSLDLIWGALDRVVDTQSRIVNAVGKTSERIAALDAIISEIYKVLKTIVEGLQ